ncbi:MAG: signal recognition particle protein [Tissierellia bacterium]|jgi:signal recognition particle subunit SRP54|nr:signal recognition particle protein [Bacillota bacterium]NLK57869.1 signal recognition particle protein [Tissierellia bacterium]
MIFESLSDKLQTAMKNLRGKGKLNEQDIDVAMREVRLALLEADVNFRVVKDFVNRIKERAKGAEVMESLTPGQMVVKIVNEELTALMGKKEEKLILDGKKPVVMMLCGLQGAGKTTHAAKLAMLLKKQNQTPLLVACDVYRPAAVKQLQVVGKQVDVPVYERGTDVSPVTIAKEAVEKAKRDGNTVVLIDTAGRLHIDETLMQELQEIEAAVKPTEILLVVDAMTGQDAVNVAENFDKQLSLTGVILTKLDGDARGGAALSIRAVTQKPIKFIGTGEKLDQLEVFYPERMAGRILGMGDVMTLIERAQQNIDEQKAKELEQKMRSASFTFDDFLDQLNQMRNMGPLENILGMIPGMNAKALKGIQIDEKEIGHVEALVLSMTKEERANPEIINASRKNRIAKGAGLDVVQLNKLLKQFKDMKKMMKKFSSMGKGKKRGMQMPFF